MAGSDFVRKMMETDLKYCKKDQLIPRVFLSRNKMFLLLFDMVAIIILSNQDGDAIFLRCDAFQNFFYLRA